MDEIAERFTASASNMVWGLRKCSTCGEIFNRDTNAAINIWVLGMAALRGEERPEPFCRPSVVEDDSDVLQTSQDK